LFHCDQSSESKRKTTQGNKLTSGSGSRLAARELVSSASVLQCWPHEMARVTKKIRPRLIVCRAIYRGRARTPRHQNPHIQSVMSHSCLILAAKNNPIPIHIQNPHIQSLMFQSCPSSVYIRAPIYTLHGLVSVWLPKITIFLQCTSGWYAEVGLS
jgi:hypothetical protein